MAVDRPVERIDQATARLAAIRSSRVARLLLRIRWAILAVLTAGSVALDADQPPVDIGLFLHAGDILLSPAWADVFADRAVQAGPVFLAFFGAVAELARMSNQDPLLIVSVIVQFSTVFFVVRLVRRGCRELLPGVDSSARELFAGLLVLALDMPSLSYLSGHPAELLIIVLWCHAALDIRAGRPCHAVGRVILTASLVTQGALGLAILLARPGPLRRSLVPAGVAAAGCAAVYLPFKLFGVVNTQQMTWPVVPSSSLAPFLGVDYPFSWYGRLLQAALALAAGLFFARMLRADRSALWIIPAAMIVIRVSVDPFVASYYWVGVAAAYVVAICLADRGSLRLTLPAYLGGYALLLSNVHPPLIPGCVVLAGLTVTALLVRAKRQLDERSHIERSDPAEPTTSPAQARSEQPAPT